MEIIGYRIGPKRPSNKGQGKGREGKGWDGIGESSVLKVSPVRARTATTGQFTTTRAAI